MQKAVAVGLAELVRAEAERVPAVVEPVAVVLVLVEGEAAAAALVLVEAAQEVPVAAPVLVLEPGPVVVPVAPVQDRAAAVLELAPALVREARAGAGMPTR